MLIFIVIVELNHSYFTVIIVTHQCVCLHELHFQQLVKFLRWTDIVSVQLCSQLANRVMLPGQITEFLANQCHRILQSWDAANITFATQNVLKILV